MLLLSFSTLAQKKKIAEKIKNAREGDSSYVIFKSGERKDIKSWKLPTAYKPGNVVCTDGKKLTLSRYSTSELQTPEGYYKSFDYTHRGASSIEGLAARIAKGVYNVYRLQIYYKAGFNDYGGEVLYFVENKEKGISLIMQNDKKMVDYVDSLVSKSKAARESIAEIRQH
jgi:hypothetical protein